MESAYCTHKHIRSAEKCLIPSSYFADRGDNLHMYQYFLWLKLEFLSFGIFPVDVMKLVIKPDSKVITRTYLLTVLTHLIKDKKVIVSSQHEFVMGKSCLTSVMAFDNEMTGSVDERGTVDAACLDFGKVFDTVSHNILDKLLKYRLEK